ncbi:unnamed protein product [Arabidopsis halleri]
MITRVKSNSSLVKLNISGSTRSWPRKDSLSVCEFKRNVCSCTRVEVVSYV